jgi:hypothetical protein
MDLIPRRDVYSKHFAHPKPVPVPALSPSIFQPLVTELEDQGIIVFEIAIRLPLVFSSAPPRLPPPLSNCIHQRSCAFFPRLWFYTLFPPRYPRITPHYKSKFPPPPRLGKFRLIRSKSVAETYCNLIALTDPHAQTNTSPQAASRPQELQVCRVKFVRSQTQTRSGPHTPSRRAVNVS